MARFAIVNSTRSRNSTSMGLVYISTWLIHYKIMRREDLLILDVFHDDVMQQLQEFKPDVVGLSAMTSTYTNAVEIAKEIRQRFPKVKVVIGGVHISTHTPSYKPELFDVAVIDEGEETCGELMRCFEAEGQRFVPAKLKSIKGLIFTDERGAVVHTPKRPPVANLDDIPMPDYSLIKGQFYRYDPDAIELRRLGRYKIIDLFTSRGCPYACAFCSTKVFWNTVRAHSPKRSVDEIEHLYRTYGIDMFSICDDLFSLNKKRIWDMADELERRGLLGKVNFIAQARANQIDDELCAAFKRMGIVNVTFGLESASNKSLVTLKEGKVTAADNRTAIETLGRYGLGASGSFILGAPGETIEEMRKTVAFMRWMTDQPNVLRFWYGCAVPLPNTDFWEMAMEQNMVSDEHMNWELLDLTHDHYDAPPELWYKGACAQEDFNVLFFEIKEVMEKLHFKVHMRHVPAFRIALNIMTKPHRVLHYAGVFIKSFVKTIFTRHPAKVFKTQFASWIF